MINTLTSLRLVFALLVFASHLVIISDTFSGHLFVEGYVGVSFFFILSGFIIAHNYTGRVNTPAERKDYYIARIARIYPLHLLTLIAAIALSGFAIGSLLSWVQLGMSATLTNAYIPRSDFFFAFYIMFPLPPSRTISRQSVSPLARPRISTSASGQLLRTSIASSRFAPVLSTYHGRPLARYLSKAC